MSSAESFTGKGGIMICLFLFLCSFAAAADTAERLPNLPGSYEEIDASLDRQLRRLHIPGAALAIVEGGEIVHFHGFGEAWPGVERQPDGGIRAAGKNRAVGEGPVRGESPDLSTPFFIGSLTKSFTALAVMQLVEAGKIDLDAPVRTYLPWFGVADPSASQRMTVRHLLNQTSGISMMSGMRALADFDADPGSNLRHGRELSSFTPSRMPGGEFEYSDTNFNLLGLIVEAASGETYAGYVENHIFAPLGMIHSHTSPAEARTDDLAVGSTFLFGFPRAVPDLPRPSGSLPSGQIISSAGDMARYMTAMLRGGTYNGVSVLSPAGVEELHRPAAAAGSMGVDMGTYAMGWFVEEADGGRRIWHDGMVPDFFSYMVLLPEQDRAMILLVNGNHMIVNFSLLDVCEALTDMLTGQPVETEASAGIYWILRCFLLVPVLQALGIFLTIRMAGRWKRNRSRRPKTAVVWGVHILLASIPHLVLAGSVITLMAMGMVRFMLLFMPDMTALIMGCGGISCLWLVLRPWVILGSLRFPRRRAGRNPVPAITAY